MPAHERRLIICQICHGHVGHMVRYQVRYWAHWSCKLEPLSLDKRKAFLATLDTRTLQHAPGLVLDELDLLEFSEQLLTERIREAV